MPPSCKTTTVPSKRPRADDDGDAVAVTPPGDNDRRLAAWQERCKRLENLVKELRPRLNVEPIVGPCPETTGVFDYDMRTRHLRALDIPPLLTFRRLEDVAKAPPRAPYGDFRPLGMFPHIIDEIVSYLTPAQLIALRAASRGLCEYVDTRLAEHLVLEVRDSRITTTSRGTRSSKQCMSLQPTGCYDPSVPRPKPTFSKGDVHHIHQFSAMPPPYQPRFSKVRLAHIGAVVNVRNRGRSTIAEIDSEAVPYLERARIVDLVQNSKLARGSPLEFLNPLTSHLSKVDVLRIGRAVGHVHCPVTPRTLIYFTYRAHSSGWADFNIPDGTEKVVLVVALNHINTWGCGPQYIEMVPSVKELVVILHEVRSAGSSLSPLGTYHRGPLGPLDRIFGRILFVTPHIKLTIVGPDPANTKGMDCAALFMRKIPNMFVETAARHSGRADLDDPKHHVYPDIRRVAQEYINKSRIMTFDAYRADVGDKQFDLEMMAEDWMPHDSLGSCPSRLREWLVG